MAICGIKKYDSLPPFVKHLDVDMLRWVLSRRLNPYFIDTIPIIRHLFTPNMDENRVRELLDKAIILNNKTGGIKKK